MKLSSVDLESLQSIVIDAARQASDYIQTEAGKPRDVISKDGHTPASQVVTEVDFESQRMILAALEESMNTYEIGLLTEESEDDGSRLSCDYFWCIDPIDGTLPFIENIPGYSVSIGLISQTGGAIIGVIADPVTGNIYHAVRGGGVFKNGEPVTMELGRELTLVIDRSLALQDNWEEVLERTKGIAKNFGLDGLKLINFGGAAMNACWVIENAPAVYFKLPKPEEGGGGLWDFAGSACLFGELEAGVVCDFDGKALKLNRENPPYMNLEGVIYASSVELAEAVRGLGVTVL